MSRDILAQRRLASRYFIVGFTDILRAITRRFSDIFKLTEDSKANEIIL